MLFTIGQASAPFVVCGLLWLAARKWGHRV